MPGIERNSVLYTGLIKITQSQSQIVCLQNRSKKCRFCLEFLALYPWWVSKAKCMGGAQVMPRQAVFKRFCATLGLWWSHVTVTSSSPHGTRAFPIPPPSSIIYGSTIFLTMSYNEPWLNTKLVTPQTDRNMLKLPELLTRLSDPVMCTVQGQQTNRCQWSDCGNNWHRCQ